MSYFQEPVGAVGEQSVGTLDEESVEMLDEESVETFDEESVETFDEQHTQEHRMPRPVGARLGEFRGRISRALASLERGQLEAGDGDQFDETYAVLDEVTGAEQDTGFRAPDPTASGDETAAYDPTEADVRIAELERELEELRATRPPMSVAEELERLGEQTASILVVAHDQARETTRLAQEQADRCVSDAAANAVSITEQAKRDLREVDEETDVVWRERARLIDDARSVGAALIALADEAAVRFPEEGKTIQVSRITHD
jgi:hypothetical protein